MAKKTTASSEKRNKSVPVVAIGASDGDLAAISELLLHLSPDTGRAYVYVPPPDFTHESMIVTMLSKLTQMPVRKAKHRMPLRPNEVYITLSDKNMEVIDGTLVLKSRQNRPLMYRPIDRFFISLAVHQKEKSIAVLLSGRGTDGTLGLKAIKRAGGMTFARNGFNPIPGAAVAEKAVDKMIPPDEIAREIERLSQKALAEAEHKSVQCLLEEREARFQGITDNVPMLIWVAGADGLYTFFNKTRLQFTGCSMDEEMSYGWAKRIHPDDRKTYQQLYDDHVKRRQPFRTEYRLMRHDGEYRWMLENAKPLFSTDGAFIGYIGTCAEVHDQKLEAQELESRFVQRTQALHEANINLKRSNEELRQYAYIASHDLQEPLRKIVTFSGRIQKKFADALPEQGNEYLSKIMASAQRMTRLIDDLLTFSRTIHQNRKFVTVDLNDVLQEVLQDFDLIIAEKNAIVRVGHLPTIEAVPLQMAQLFYNLVGNALKFTSPSKPPLISIETEEVAPEEIQRRLPQVEPGAYRKIVVRDNGIGFEPAFSEQIFSIFQRLHDRDTYMGTGIGLALCRRIINNHGGDLYAEGKEGEGAAFYILIPVKHTDSGADSGEDEYSLP